MADEWDWFDAWFLDEFLDAFSRAPQQCDKTPGVDNPFWDEVVDQLIAEPDPKKREGFLARMDDRTRRNVEISYAKRTKGEEVKHGK